MKFSRRSALLIGAAGFSGLIGAACDKGGPGGGKTASVTPGNMPEGGEWTGKYYDKVYGYFHLIKEGKTISGKWERPGKDKWGEIHGEVTGDVFKFSWTEYTKNAIGPNAQANGRGYFVYKRPPGENVDDVLEGEIGRDRDEVGDNLSCIKQRNEKPDPDSIGGTHPTDFSGGDWDGNNKEKDKAPEGPTAPP